MTTFDYTSRDYSSIQEDLLARAAEVLPEWTSRDSSDFGMLMVDLWSYMGDVLHFYVDRAAREAFLNTATQRESVLAIANLLDYIPVGRRAATATISLNASQTTATDSSPIYLPQFTRFVATPLVETATPVVFTLNNPIAFVATSAGASANIEADGVVYQTYPKTQIINVGVTEGERFEETYTSTGQITQRISLKKTGVVNASVNVLVSEGPNGQDLLYNYVERLISGTNFSRIFTIETNADGQATVVFGNGINGKIPTTNAPIKITYRRSRGTAGNVLAGSIKALESTTVLNKPPLDGLVVVPNTVRAAGGFDAESIASMRSNIPVSFRTQDRAVSLKDYKDLVKRVSGVVKSTAFVSNGGGASANTVEILAVEPQADYGSSNTLVLSQEVITEIENYLAPREIVFVTSNVGASVTLTPVNLVASIKVKDGYVREDVKDKVDTAVREIFSFDNMDFGASVSLGTLYRTILDVDGVDFAVVTRFTTTGNNVIDDVGGFVGVGSSQTSMLVISTTSTYTLTMSGGITALGS